MLAVARALAARGHRVTLSSGMQHAEDFAVRPVSKLVNNVNNEGPELLDPPVDEPDPSESYVLTPLFED